MKTGTIKLSDIAKHPSKRMDAEYHLGKKAGKKAYKIGEDKLLVEDDIHGKTMLTEADANKYNDAMREIAKSREVLRHIKSQI